MFCRAMLTIHLLDRAQRVRENHCVQTYAATVQPDPVPKPSAASEWGFVHSAKQEYAPDSEFESSQSFSSSEMSGDAIILPSRPSPSHYITPMERELEPVPVSTHARTEEVEPEKHCTPNCNHVICKKEIHLDNGHECFCKFLCAPPANISLENLDIFVAMDSYEDAPPDEEIMVHYPEALGVLERLRNKGELDLWHFLLHSPSYTKETINKATRHATAAKSANTFIHSGMEDTLAKICSLTNSQSHVISVQELEAQLEEGLRLDCVAWAQRWVCREEKHIDWNWFADEMQKNEGCKVAFEKAREYMQDVVGALVWWDGERREVEEVEQARRKAHLLILDHTVALAGRHSRHE